MTPLAPAARLACLAGIAAALVLTGCRTTEAVPDAQASSLPGPTTTSTSTAAPDAAARLAERYQQDGGLRDVHGLQHTAGPGGVPLITVWTREDEARGAEEFQDLRDSVTAFLRDEERLELGQGYLLDVFGPDGGLRHRLDARP
ncbi:MULTISPECIES: hypothetical protein [Streptomyces]|uniref:hypothetical protein n=1 Tax=Streptomyces TaxID=1883 RepID=UPI002249671F|nr:hypothetical protein [Streptomyces sp. JHD 1]MCX2971799.1 hypothetical protein [Streptomyces sp. JHD 1]